MNLTAAESRILDVDRAKEMMVQTKAFILTQASRDACEGESDAQGYPQLLR